MPHQSNNRVLVINPGSTSTKFGVFKAEGAEWVSSVHHGDEEIEPVSGPLDAGANRLSRRVD